METWTYTKKRRVLEMNLAPLTQFTGYPGREGQLWKAQDSYCAHEQQFGPPVVARCLELMSSLYTDKDSLGKCKHGRKQELATYSL